MAAAIEVRGASKSFGAVRALAPIDLSIESGRTTILLGPSGCGKSTLLRLMLGLVEPDQGGVLFEGTRVSASNALQVRRQMGYVLQDGGLFPHLTARENVLLMALWLGRSKRAMDERLAMLADLARLPLETLERYPLELSGGQRQRVSLMRALMLDPDVLLLDEPLGALDPMIRAELQTDLREAFRSLGKTVVMVTHDLREAGFLGEIIVLLREGRIVQVSQDGLASFRRAPADPFVTRFVEAQSLSEAVDTRL